MTDSVSAAETLDDLVARLTDEGLIPMRAAASLYGKGVHKATPTRHATKGVRLPNGSMLKLESVRVGGQLKSSRAAVLRFFARQNGEAPAPPCDATPRARKTRGAKAAADLDALGVK